MFFSTYVLVVGCCGQRSGTTHRSIPWYVYYFSGPPQLVVHPNFTRFVFPNKSGGREDALPVSATLVRARARFEFQPREARIDLPSSNPYTLPSDSSPRRAGVIFSLLYVRVFMFVCVFLVVPYPEKTALIAAPHTHTSTPPESTKKPRPSLIPR